MLSFKQMRANKALGSFYKGVKSGGRWSKEESKHHINVSKKYGPFVCFEVFVR